MLGQNEITLSGKVLDSLGNPLSGANVLAYPMTKGDEIIFGITEKEGRYRIRLNKDEDYTIEVGYLGYYKSVLKLLAKQDKIHDFIMRAKVNVLEEVTLEYDIPVQIKEDTITYSTDAFVDGKERKLREVLKKLPGIEVDREGNVLAQGRKVTKVLVEDKLFFTGNSKLAVNNIPADAVSQVQVLDNYNRIGFLKGLEDSDDIALNIKLKEEKKKFSFGDIETGTDFNNRYLVHPNLFRYSPKTNINLIGDLNNIGTNSFTMKDYLEFNGGFGKLLGNIKGYLELSTDDFSQFLNNRDFKENTNRFGALNIRRILSPKTDINTYLITSDSDTRTEERVLNIFTGETPFNETRNTKNGLGNTFVLGKLNIEHRPTVKKDLTANTFVKFSSNNSSGNILTQSQIRDNTIETSAGMDALDFKQNVAYNGQLSKRQTLSMEGALTHQRSRRNGVWRTDQLFLSDFLPLEEETLYDIRQTRKVRSTALDVIVKDYWVLNNFNHIYTTLGTNLLFEDYATGEQQLLSDGSTNDFSENGFGNNVDYSLNDIFLGVEYKFLTGIFTIRSGLFYHYYRWANSQRGLNFKQDSGILLPELKVELEFDKSQKLLFRYQKKVRFPRTGKLGESFFLNNFNSITLGRGNLENERFHNLSLNFYKFSLFKGLSFNTGMFYTKRTRSIKNNVTLNGIDQLIAYTMFDRPEESLRGNFNLKKRIGPLRYGMAVNANYREFFQLVNNEVSQNISRSINVKGELETFFKKAPNLNIGYSYGPSGFTTKNFTNTFVNQEFFAGIDYVFLKDFKLRGDLRQIDYRNVDQGIRSTFVLANGSLSYQKEDTPWGIELMANNLFDTRVKRQNSFRDFLISDQTILIIPRVVLLKLTYKL